jgi:hypothetical protein
MSSQTEKSWYSVRLTLGGVLAPAYMTNEEMAEWLQENATFPDFMPRVRRVMVECEEETEDD